MSTLHDKFTITILFGLSVVLLLSSAAWPDNELKPPEQAWFPKAPALPSAQDPIIKVSDVQGLIKAVTEAEPGQTILVADGNYMMPHYIQISADNVTLRGASGHRERVIIDGAQSHHTELTG